MIGLKFTFFILAIYLVTQVRSDPLKIETESTAPTTAKPETTTMMSSTTEPVVKKKPLSIYDHLEAIAEELLDCDDYDDDDDDDDDDDNYYWCW